MAEGKQLSWGHSPERHKVATLDGTLFAKAGTISGGMAGNLAGRAQRWGDKEYETLKKVLQYDGLHQTSLTSIKAYPVVTTALGEQEV